MRQDATIHSIQLLRSVAATLVVLFHAQQAFATRVSPALFHHEGYLFGFGAVGVHIFFVISGFIMVLTSCQPDRPYNAGRFFRRRFLRIYPIYWLCALAYVGVHAVIGISLLLEFLAGAAVGWLALAGRLPVRWGAALTGAGVALFVAGIALGYERLPSAISWGIPSAVLVLGLVTWEAARGASPAVRRLGKLGDSSYVLYLIHILVITLAVAISHALPPAMVLEPPVAAFIIALTGIALAEAIHRGVERRMLALRRECSAEALQEALADSSLFGPNPGPPGYWPRRDGSGD